MTAMIAEGTSRAPRLHAAQVAMAGCGTFVALLALLHLLEPEIDPAWRFISEYALGAHGWLMGAAFLALALAYGALAWALRPHLCGRAGRAAFWLLLVSSAGLSLAGLFTTDPVTTAPGAATLGGKLHSAGGALGMAMPLAAALVTWSLWRLPAWRARRAVLAWTTLLALAGFLLSIVWISMSLARSGGAFGPDVQIGWPNRVEIIAYCAWLWAAARGVPRSVA